MVIVEKKQFSVYNISELKSRKILWDIFLYLLTKLRKIIMSISLSVIIPTYDRHSSLERTLSALESNLPQNTEVIIIDQSPDRVVHKIKFCSRFPFIKYFCVPLPNLPAARNIGIEKSRGGIILFIDDDAIIDKKCILEHLNTHSQKGVHAVAGRIKQMNNASWADSDSVTRINHETGETTGNFDLDYQGDVLYASGGHMSIKRNILIETGLFNARFEGNALFEEVEFFSRLRKKGYTIRYNRNAVVYHYPVSFGGCHIGNQPQYLRQRLHNHMLFYILHIKRIPSRALMIYFKNLIEFISRTKNRQHSFAQILLCLLSIFKAYINAGISYFTPQKLAH